MNHTPLKVTIVYVDVWALAGLCAEEKNSASAGKRIPVYQFITCCYTDLAIPVAK
jgi:hypothetical protein